MRLRHFWVQKEGNREAEYEDAFQYDLQAGRFAIADGATESSFSREWAQILVEGFMADESWTHIFQQPRSARQWHEVIRKQCLKWLDQLRDQWRERLDELKRARGGQWPWFVENRIREGAVATFCGLLLLPTTPTPAKCCRLCRRSARSATQRYLCLAVGDASLFQLRGDQLVFSFPVKKAADFSNTPPLLCSQSGPAAWPSAPFRWRIRRWKQGDTFLLMTDALAGWFLSEYESGNRPWQEIRRHLLQAEDEPATNPALVGENVPVAAVPDASVYPSHHGPVSIPDPAAGDADDCPEANLEQSAQQQAEITNIGREQPEANPEQPADEIQGSEPVPPGSLATRPYPNPRSDSDPG